MKTKKICILLVLLIVMSFVSACSVVEAVQAVPVVPAPAPITTEDKNTFEDLPETEIPKAKTEEPTIISKEKEEPITITLSFAGDFTLGKNATSTSSNNFDNMYKKVGQYPKYFLKNVYDIFNKDDITFVNLETTLTTATKYADKEFKFKGLPEYRNILVDGSVEVVSLANNHSMDYFQKGYDDTIENLKLVNVGYVDGKVSYIKEVKGIKVGFLGFKGWDNSKSKKDEISKSIESLRNSGCEIVAIMFHWGNEKVNYPIKVQEDLARYAIDQGADVIVGGHAHVLQSTEIYKGKPIIYGLGNFCYGGHSNPPDKDTMIFQQTFTFIDGQKQETLDAKVIPCSVTSKAGTNNFQPTPLTGEEKTRVIKRLNTFSKNRNIIIDDKGNISIPNKK